MRGEAFNRITIVGLGLIGGSLGIAIRRKRLARTIVGCSRKPQTLRRAKRCGAIDAGTSNLRRAVAKADLVVLATPVETIVPLARRLLPAMRRGAILTDVGSTKGEIVRALERAVPDGVRYVGSHPLAGSEQRGIAAAQPRLFDRSVCVVTASSRTDPAALRVVTGFWRRLGCRVVTLEPRRHDFLLATVSHLPHLLAFCLTELADGQELSLAPRSFRDATRVAKSDPGLWEGILLGNRPALAQAIRRFDRRWRLLRGWLGRGNRSALRQFLISAKAKRDGLQDD